MHSFNIDKLKLQIGALTRAIVNCDNEKDAKILLDLQRDLMEMYDTIKNPKI